MWTCVDLKKWWCVREQPLMKVWVTPSGWCWVVISSSEGKRRSCCSWKDEKTFWLRAAVNVAVLLWESRNKIWDLTRTKRFSFRDQQGIISCYIIYCQSWKSELRLFFFRDNFWFCKLKTMVIYFSESYFDCLESFLLCLKMQLTLIFIVFK